MEESNLSGSDSRIVYVCRKCVLSSNISFRYKELLLKMRDDYEKKNYQKNVKNKAVSLVIPQDCVTKKYTHCCPNEDKSWTPRSNQAITLRSQRPV